MTPDAKPLQRTRAWAHAGWSDAWRKYGWRQWIIPAPAFALLVVAVWPPTGVLDVLVARQRYEVATDIRYADGARHTLDVYRPRGAVNAPVLVFFYGGGWQSGAKNMYRFIAASLAARGYITVVPDYRLYPDVKFPDFLVDGANAVQWVRQNIATFNGDTSRMFIMGHSAGAYIAAMLALDGTWLRDVGLDPARDVAGFIGVSGPYDFMPLGDRTLAEIFGGANRPVTQPITYAAGRKPPALLLTGGADRIVEPGNSARLAAKLRENGNDATEILYPSFGHITILAGFAPFLAKFFEPLRDMRNFVARIRPV